MSELDLDALLATAERAARAGGAVLQEAFGDVRGVRTKAPGDWVTDADLGSEREIRRVLGEEWPEIAFFGEETGGDERALGWYVDPLDGTANFVHQFEAFAVSVALVRDERPIVGAVYAPALERIYTARLGGGAQRDGRPIGVSARGVSEAICATGFPFRRKETIGARYLEAFRLAFATFEDLRRVGAASLDLCWVADGVFDGYFELALGTWDVAAGGLIVREAGGVVTDWRGDDDAWLRSGDVLAGSPEVHRRLLEVSELA